MQDSDIPEKYKALSKEFEKLQGFVKRTAPNQALSEESKKELDSAKDSIVEAAVDTVAEDATNSAKSHKASYLVALDTIRKAKKTADRALGLALKRDLNSNT